MEGVSYYYLKCGMVDRCRAGASDSHGSNDSFSGSWMAEFWLKKIFDFAGNVALLVSCKSYQSNRPGNGHA
jgi:hypothetical protein